MGVKGNERNGEASPLINTHDDPQQSGCCCFGTASLVYISHFMSAWGDRMWYFGAGLFLVIINPDSLQLTAAYGLTMGASVLLLGPVLGDWVDNTRRLRAAQVTLVLQNMTTVVCAVVIYCYLVYKEDILDAAAWLEYVAYALIILLSCGANLAAVANTIAVERDWIVEICGQDEDRLATMTATMKAIDLSTQILAPIATGQVMTYAGSEIGALFIAGWNLASCGIEYYLLHKVYNTVPALRKTKDLKKKEQDLNTPDDTQEENGCKFFSGVTIIVTGWKTFMQYEVWLSGLALAFLYMTVLGFDNVTIGYAEIQGLNESIIGAFQGVGGFMGIMGTVLYPQLRRCLGLARSALVSLCLLVTCLTPCLVSVWLPGSTFDLFGPPLTLENCTQPSVVTAAINVTTSQTPPLATTVGGCETSQVSVYVMMAGIVLARTGLWSADLSITQMFLESVAEGERGVVNGVQSSLNQLMDMIKFALVMGLPLANQFGLLIILSYSSVFTGALLQGIFVCCLAPKKFMYGTGRSMGYERVYEKV